MINSAIAWLWKDKKFVKAVTEYFHHQAEEMEGDVYKVSQRIDGIMCFSEMPKYNWWKFRLDLMYRRKQLRKFKNVGAFASARRMYWYGLREKS